MSELRVESWTMPAADLGPENPLPPLRSYREAHVISDAPGVPEEMLRNMAYGHVPNILPYTMQDGYTRRLRPRAFRVAVLENETLRATFALELGGRLWSLHHKASGRELLQVNPVYQPANLAIRNAWFSGGLEWNIGLRGHCPFTCSPVFAARVQAPDGTPVLRLYEWERIRQVPFQIDAYLPNGSPVLLVRIRIRNPHDRTVPMYWWSNAAVPETENTRVLVPADSAYSFGYGGGGLAVVPVPAVGGTDITYPTRIERSADFFFHVSDGERAWIAALDREGKGLVQVSTGRLKGRKLFLWGMGPGGRRWQQFLSQPGQAYIEIQSGLARTQMEHLPMPAGAEWAWLEAYGLMEADPKAAHGSDWAHARQHVTDLLEEAIPRAALEAEYERGAAFVDRPPEELLQRGSGWGALEQLRRADVSEPPFCSEGLVYDETSLGVEQAPWLGLLRNGAMPAPDTEGAPHGYLVQSEWRALLEEALSVGRCSHWLAWLHLGVMRYYAEEREGARQAWERSLAEATTPWALRNLAVLALDEERTNEAADLYVRAVRDHPSLLPLAVECGRTVLQADRPAEWLDLLDDLADEVRSSGRVRLLEGQAALAVGNLKRIEQLFEQTLVIDDLREGERSLSHLWFDYHERRLSVEEHVPIDDGLRARVRREYPVPSAIDFRMSGDSPVSPE
jgi:hypothetical protein